jgi:ATP adenylyltransferase
MDRLWAPWRKKYITAKKQKGCIFCRSARARHKNYVLFKTKHSISMLNIFPYNNGHLLCAPLRHIKEFTQLKDNELLDLFKALNKTQKILKKVLKPDGFNIGINVSSFAGAGVAGHIHIHIVPRWKGDTNFMPVLFDTKVVSESLHDLYKRLKHAESKAD